MLARIQQLIVAADRRHRPRRRMRSRSSSDSLHGRSRRRCSSPAVTRRPSGSSSSGFAPRTRRTRPTGRRCGQLLSAWCQECLIAPRVFLWRQPFRSAAIADSVPAAARGRRGVVLVHGFFCNRGLWNPWMQRLEEEGVPFVAREPRTGVRLDRPISRRRSKRRSPGSKTRPEWPRSWSATAWAGWRSVPGGRAKAGRRRAFIASSPSARRIAAPGSRATPARATAWRCSIEQPLARSPGAGRRRTAPTTDSPASGVTATTSSSRPAVQPCRELTTGTLAGTPHVAMAFHPDVFALRASGPAGALSVSAA